MHHYLNSKLYNRKCLLQSLQKCTDVHIFTHVSILGGSKRKSVLYRSYSSNQVQSCTVGAKYEPYSVVMCLIGHIHALD